MTKVQKPGAGRVLTPAEIQTICFYDELDIRYHDYQGQALRAIDMTTGRLVDMT